MAAGMADPGQGVVLRTDHNPDRAASRDRPDRGRDSPAAHLHRETGLLQRIGYAARRAHLVEGGLRVTVNGVAQVEQVLPGLLDYPMRYGLGIRTQTDLPKPRCPYLIRRLPESGIHLAATLPNEGVDPVMPLGHIG